MKVTKEQLKEFGKIYETFYQNGYDAWLEDLGEILIQQHRDIAKAFIEARKDILSSDRELAAYAVWFMKYNNAELLKKHRTVA